MSREQYIPESDVIMCAMGRIQFSKFDLDQTVADRYYICPNIAISISEKKKCHC